jgi:hypothetical protein
MVVTSIDCYYLGRYSSRYAYRRVNFCNFMKENPVRIQTALILDHYILTSIILSHVYRFFFSVTEYGRKIAQMVFRSCLLSLD